MKQLYACLVALLLLLIAGACKNKNNYVPAAPLKETIFASTKEIPDSDFLGDKTCKTCHSKVYTQWQGSHHDKAMQHAVDSTVLGNFNNKVFKSQGVTNHFYRKGKNFYVNTEGPDGTYQDYKIVYTFGVTPLQQYIVKFPNGRFQCLRTAWDSQKNKWFDLYPDFKIVHSEWLHWSRGGLNWNNMCADCHSTNVRKNYNPEQPSYQTKYAIINVSCEACHGPGKQHVERIQKEGQKYLPGPDFQMTRQTPPKELVDQCARCHMRREQISSHFNFEGTLLDHYFPELINTRTYFEDGQINDEDYVYGSFLQSKMYKHNVTCTNCHNPHSLTLKFEGNKLCTQCHVETTYDRPSHHRHTMGTDAAKCINCHMTGKYYMGNDFRRDHSFRIPRPDLSIKYGTPNACTQCHKDKDDTWAWKKFEKLYGVPKKHFSDLLAPGLTGKNNGLKDLLTLAKDTIYPDIARASAVGAMSNYLSQKTIDSMRPFLTDHSPLVRAATLDVLGTINLSQELLNTLLPSLEDSKRAVRVKAFFALASLPKAAIPTAYKTTYELVEKEFNTYLKTTADFPGGLVRKGNYALKQGNLKTGIANYETALKMDNFNNMARTNLANLYYRDGKFEAAEQAFKTIIEQEPEYGPTYYSYGLLLAELDRTPEAIKNMVMALKYMPDNTGVYYNLSLLYDKINAPKKAENTIASGLKKTPNDPRLLYMLAYIYNKNGQQEKAKNIAQRLTELYPDNADYRQLYNSLNKRGF